MSAGAIWGSLSSTQKGLAVVFLLVNLLMLGGVAATLGFIYTNTSTAQDVIDCRVGWTEFNGFCYKAFGTGAEAFTIDQVTCVEEGAALASIQSQEENDFILSLLTTEDSWLNGILNEQGSNWVWGDGSGWGYTNWAPSQPGEGPLLKMSTGGQWISVKETGTAEGFVCKIHSEATTTGSPATTTTSTELPTCDDGWTENASINSCYQVFTESGGITFAAAEEACVAYKDKYDVEVHLTSVLDEAENTFVSELLSSEDAWLGGKYVSDAWTWIDSSPWDESAFDSWETEPVDPQEGDSVLMKADTGTWTNVADGETATTYVCKMGKIFQTTSTTSTTTSPVSSTTTAAASTTTVPASTTTDPASTTTAPASTTTAPASTTTVPATTTTAAASTTTVPASTTTAAVSTTTSPPMSDCETDWSDNSGVFGDCYRAFPATQTWADAQTDCESEGSNLASILTDDENKFVSSLLPDTELWIGGKYADADGWTWVDGTTWSGDYTNWVQTGVATDGEVIKLIVSKQWTHTTSSESLGYICKKNK